MTIQLLGVARLHARAMQLEPILRILAAPSQASADSTSLHQRYAACTFISFWCFTLLAFWRLSIQPDDYVFVPKGAAWHARWSDARSQPLWSVCFEFSVLLVCRLWEDADYCECQQLQLCIKVLPFSDCPSDCVTETVKEMRLCRGQARGSEACLYCSLKWQMLAAFALSKPCVASMVILPCFVL